MTREPTSVPVSLHIQEFTGGGPLVRFGTCRCIHHAGTAPSRAARACEVHVWVRNATQHLPPVRIRTPGADRSGTVTREAVARGVSTHISGTVTPERGRMGVSRAPLPDKSVVRRVGARRASACPIDRRRVSLHVQEFTGAGSWVRFGTCGCIHHAGGAPSRAARAYEVHLQVRNATPHYPPVTIRHSRCTAGRRGDTECRQRSSPDSCRPLAGIGVTLRGR